MDADALRQKIEAEDAAQAAAVLALRQTLETLLPDEEGGPDTSGTAQAVSEVLAGMACGHLAVEWIAERYWAKQMPRVVAELNRAYEKLDAGKIGADNPVDFNDLDDRVWREESPHFRVVVHTTQSMNFLYVWRKADAEVSPEATGRRGFRRLHVRRFYDRYDDPRYDRAGDEFERSEDAKFAARVSEGDRAEAVKDVAYLEQFADDGVQYPRRPSLDAYRAKGFEVGYGDARDPGYVLSWDEFAEKVDHAAGTHALIHLVESCFVPGMVYALFEEGR